MRADAQHPFCSPKFLAGPRRQRRLNHQGMCWSPSAPAHQSNPGIYFGTTLPASTRTSCQSPAPVRPNPQNPKTTRIWAKTPQTAMSNTVKFMWSNLPVVPWGDTKKLKSTFKSPTKTVAFFLSLVVFEKILQGFVPTLGTEKHLSKGKSLCYQ